jgi:hypothetical protein
MQYGRKRGAIVIAANSHTKDTRDMTAEVTVRVSSAIDQCRRIGLLAFEDSQILDITGYSCDHGLAGRDQS